MARASRVAAWMIAGALLTGPALARAEDVYVQETGQFRAALKAAVPGTRIFLRPGVYEGGTYQVRLRGTAGQPIVIAGADPNDRPLIRGGTTSLQLSGPEFVVVRDLILEGASENGLNLDDGGHPDQPAHHVRVERVLARDIGGDGIESGIKLSGVDQFLILGCEVETWGKGGAGINLIGAHDGNVQSCVLRYGDSQGACGVQAKGGSARITIRGCRFEHAGARAVQIGGSTGASSFRPQPPGPAEASGITVEGNVIIGSEAAVAFASSDGGLVRFNTIDRPTRWVARILQENQAPGTKPCQGGRLTDNLVVFRSSELLEAVNVGRGTAPETFRFARNWWYCLDAPTQSRPRLPTAEEGGTYGVDPRFVDEANLDLRLRPDSPATHVGADALPGRGGRRGRGG